MDRRGAAILVIGALLLAAIGYTLVQRSREDARLREAAMAACAKQPADEVKCRNAIRRHHLECRTIGTTVVSTGPKSARSFVNPDLYADCITRGPATIKREREAARRELEGRKADVLR